MFESVDLADADDGIDIFSEEYRIYTYPDGSQFRIDAPVRLFVTRRGSHRVLDDLGLTHRPSPGYIGISWQPKAGSPAFVA